MSLSPSNPHFVRNLLEYEIERLRPDPIRYYEPGTSEAQLINWIRSTQARRLFATLMVRAAMDDEYHCAGAIRNECKLSRPAFNEMVNQCEDAGWIDVQRNEQGLRFIKGAQIHIDLWEDYAHCLGHKVINRLPKSN